VALLVVEGGRVRFANPAAARLLGHETAATLVGRAAGTLGFDQPIDTGPVDGATSVAALLAHGAWTDAEPARDDAGRDDAAHADDARGGTPYAMCSAPRRTVLRRADGSRAAVHLWAQPCGPPGAVLLTLLDASAMERQARALHRLAHVDEATGLLNRRGVVAHAQATLRAARARGVALTVLFADVDGLKRVNDVEGHAAGDRLIRVVARAFGDVVGRGAGRWGGDEFVALSPVLDAPRRWRTRFADALDARGRAEGIAGATASLGVWRAAPDAIAAPDAALDALLARADAAMYGEKRKRHAVRRVARSADPRS
jgi:diguanylate cyclase (GGDEF)-like protein